MELLHDSSGYVENLGSRLKRLEDKMETVMPVTLMKDLRRWDDEIRHFKDVENKTNTVVSSVNEQDDTIKKLDDRMRSKFIETASQINATEAVVADRYDNLISKMEDINSRIDNLEKNIDLAVRELKSEARKTSFLRKLLWLD